ncbi:MAG TPA: hypothetical protein GXX34_09860 [Clostridia bacterium]|nr:hypothetical protein [Clostridia bacterium]
MDDLKPGISEKEELQQIKTELLKELHSQVKEEKVAILEKNMKRLETLTQRTADLMAKIDAVDARLRELVGPVFEQDSSRVPLTEEQKWLITEMKQLHKEMIGELIKQRTAVVEQMKELREVDHLINIYKKELAVEGIFVDRKK